MNEQTIAQFDLPFPSGAAVDNATVTPADSIFVDSTGGILESGLLSALSYAIYVFFAVCVVMWIIISMWAAIGIIRGQGSPEAYEKGWASITNIWYGITILVVFFTGGSFIGSMFGIGNIWEWSDSLAQCNGQGVLFADVERQSVALSDYYENTNITNKNAYAFCCPQTTTWELLGADPAIFDANEFNTFSATCKGPYDVVLSF